MNCGEYDWSKIKVLKTFMNLSDKKKEKIATIKQNENVSVYWTEDMMYVNDESDNQATINCSLYESYKFSILINAFLFDYTATDEEVYELQKTMILDIDNQQHRFDVWDYLNDINSTFYSMTKEKINTIDMKREIVSSMIDMDFNDFCQLGNEKIIAKSLFFVAMSSKNDTIRKLATVFLNTDNCNLQAFKEALTLKHTETYYVKGSLWVNKAKYEYVDKIVINHEEVDIYKDDEIIGSILRENIDTIEEQNYDCDNQIANIEEVLPFNIKKTGDF